MSLPLLAVAVILTSTGTPAYAARPPAGTPGTPSIAASTTAVASATNPLQPLENIALHGGAVAAGVGMRNRGFGTISLSGVPSGSSITAAFLFWVVLGSGPDPSYAQGSLNGHSITGTLVGVSEDPCWGNDASFGYRADVTALVAGNGDYSLAGFASSIIDGRDPWFSDAPPPMFEGASLVLVYSNAASPYTQVVIYEGDAEVQSASILTQTLVGFTAPPARTAITTFIGADGQDATETGSTFNGAPLPSVGWDGNDPQAGPPFSRGNLWDTMTVNVTAQVAPGDTSATATVQGDNDCLVWVAQVLSISERVGANPVMIVHGINADARDLMAPALENPILDEFGPASITRFVYYQDRSFRPNRDDPACVGVAPPILPAEPNGGIPVSLDSIDPGICDSESDMALNAVALDADVHARYVQTGLPVVLLTNSMGAAIIRGMLTYSNERADGVAANEVDSVFFLEAAQDGVDALVEANENGGDGITAQLNQAAIAALAGIDFSRPAQADLTPRSDWYRWANPGPARLANHPYFNVFGNMNIVHVPCFFIWCGEPQIIMELGDIAMTPGTDDPFDTPARGGARFLLGAPGAQNHEWALNRDLLWLPDLDPDMISVIEGVVLAPEMHGNFLLHMSDINVADCRTGAQVPVSDALLPLIRGRVTGVPYECQP
jgi:hypothetical protein